MFFRVARLAMRRALQRMAAARLRMTRGTLPDPSSQDLSERAARSRRYGRRALALLIAVLLVCPMIYFVTEGTWASPLGSLALMAMPVGLIVLLVLTAAHYGQRQRRARPLIR